MGDRPLTWYCPKCGAKFNANAVVAIRLHQEAHQYEGLSEDAVKLLKALEAGKTTVDELVNALNFKPSKVYALLGALQRKGLVVKRLDRWVRKPQP
ncbi:MAG: helix-turn-helix domain-containing protein [Candidatus Nezhaarchaeales archaeon]